MSLLERLRATLAGRYAVEREVGHGGMAVVFLVQDLKHHRAVAMKTLRPEIAAAIGAERFLREIEIAARLTHPHILPLLDSGDADGILYYVMPYIEGESLRDRLVRERQLPLAQALEIARQAASALAYAHSRDVIHRDIKPENILLQGDEVLVADFGIARAITAAGDKQLTSTGIAVGTPPYMSPEQGAGEAHLNGRSDVYSLGCVLYEMLAGAPPFTGPTALAIQARRMTDPVPPLRTVRETVPENIEQAIGKALARVPADRFATAEQFGDALAAGDPVVARRPGRRRRVFAGVAGLVTVLAIVTATIIARRWPQVRPVESVILVVPPMPGLPDTGLTRLGRDLAITLSTALDGVGEIRTVDPEVALLQVEHPHGPRTRAEAAALGRRLGAATVVHGNLVRAGDKVRFELGLFTTDSLKELVRASILAPAGDLDALTDSAAWAILRPLWHRGEPPTLSLAIVTTPSVVALRRFLDGERAVFDNRWGAAESAYADAVHADSTFWLAHWRHHLTRSWGLFIPPDSLPAAVAAHAQALPERDRLYLEAAYGPFPRLRSRMMFSVRLAALRRFLDRYPDYLYGLFDYADRLTHEGPRIGYTCADARAALDRVLRLAPRLAPAWEHMLWMSLGRDTAATRQTVDALSELERREGALWDAAGYQRALYEMQRTGWIMSSAAADSGTRRLVASPDNLSWHRAYASRVLWYGFPQALIEMSTLVTRVSVMPEVNAVHQRAMAIAFAARGAWDTALVLVDRLAVSRVTPPPALDAYRLAVLGAWLSAIEPAVGQDQRARLGRLVADSSAATRAEIFWLDGLLATVRADRGGLARARAALRQTSDSSVELLDPTLSAYETALDGRQARAGEVLAASEWRRDDVEEPTPQLADHPFVRAVNRLSASRWLLAAGDTDQAVRLLSWQETFGAGPSGFALREAAGLLGGFSYLELGNIEAARGRLDVARGHYAQFLRRYDLPVAAHRHFVEEARAASRRLEWAGTGDR